MVASGVKIETPQEKQEAQLLSEIVATLEKHGKSLAELEEQKKFAGHAQDVLKLRDDIASVEAKAQERFKALVAEDRAGRLGAGSFPTREVARQVGQAIIALCRRDQAKLAELEKAAVTGGSGADGGFIAGEQFINALIRNVETYGVFAANATMFPTVAQVGGIPKRTQGVTIYYPDLGVAPTESSPKAGKKQFSCTRYSAMTYVDRWMLDDLLAVPLAQWVTQELAYALAYAEDRNGFVGDGQSSFAGVNGAMARASTFDYTAPSTKTTFQLVIDQSTTYLANLIGGMPEWTDPGLAFYLHRTIFWAYMGVKDSQGMPIANVLINATGRPGRTLFGYPAKVAQVMPKLSETAVSKAMLLLADLAKGWMIFRFQGRTELRTSEHYKFAEGYVTLVLDALEDIQQVDEDAQARLITAAS